ncbi:MAG: hypothetical protein ABF747_01195 [Bifidobacterium sp.]|uniref:Cell division protein FtsL n=1 Tax=Bifidobacterium fermentum TaxID=3059035 RepID=A0AB39UN82_9BIFI
MPAAARRIQSGARRDKRRPDSKQQETRPELQLLTNRRVSQHTLSERAQQLIHWTRTRRTPMFHFMIAFSVLGASLIGSLMLRTQMMENSFEATREQQSISRLTQDIEDDRSTLDSLQASLPEKAEKMGMVPQQSSISIDLQGYKASTSSGDKQ